MSGLADLRVGEAAARADRAERDFLKRARVLERMPRVKAVKRGRRMRRCLEALQAAIALRVVAEDYAGEDPDARLGDLEPPGLLRDRLAEAEARMRWAAERGYLAPSRARGAVGAGASAEANPRGHAK